MESIGARLKRLRETKKIPAKEMARQLNCSASTYRDWEYGRAIQGEPYNKLAEILGVGLSELLTGKPPRMGSVFRELEQARSHLDRLEKELRSFG